MIDGDPNEFIDGLHYGDERFFLFDGVKYLIEGFSEDEKRELVIWDLGKKYGENCLKWIAYSKKEEGYPVDEFEKARIFNGRTFWEAENEIQWVDC